MSMNRTIIPPFDVIERIRDQNNLSRLDVDRIVASANAPSLRDIINNYAAFIYYLSEARATRSEGVLPQENLIDFSLSELVGRKTRLSENEVFFKIFIDIVKAKTSAIFPVDFLDSISIEDAIELRNIALSKHFTEQYNTIQDKTKAAIKIEDSERLVLLLSELESFENELFNEFEAELSKELPTRLAEERQRSAGKVLHSIASIFIPGYNPDAYKELIVAGMRWAGRNKASKSIEDRISKGLTACESALESMNFLEKQVLLDFVDTMKKKYQDKMFGN